MNVRIRNDNIRVHKATNRSRGDTDQLNDQEVAFARGDASLVRWQEEQSTSNAGFRQDDRDKKTSNPHQTPVSDRMTVNYMHVSNEHSHTAHRQQRCTMLSLDLEFHPICHEGGARGKESRVNLVNLKDCNVERGGVAAPHYNLASTGRESKPLDQK